MAEILDPTTLILSHYSNESINAYNPNKTPLELITDPYFMERGPRYNAYAQLRESKLQSKMHQIDEFQQVSQIPRSEFSPLKKTVRFQESSHRGNHKIDEKIVENEQFLEIPRSEFSPLKKTVRFQGKTDENEQVLEIPRSEFSPLKKTVRFQGSSYQGGSNKKQGNSVLVQSVPDFTSAMRKENRKPSATPPASMSKRGGGGGGGGGGCGGGSRSVNSGEKQSNGKLKMMMGRKSYASIEELKGLSIAASNAINGENKGNKRGGGNVLRKSTVFSTSSRFY